MNIYRQGNPHSQQCRHCYGPKTAVRGIFICQACDLTPVGGRR